MAIIPHRLEVVHDQLGAVSLARCSVSIVTAGVERFVLDSWVWPVPATPLLPVEAPTTKAWLSALANAGSAGVKVRVVTPVLSVSSVLRIAPEPLVPELSKPVTSITAQSKPVQVPEARDRSIVPVVVEPRRLR
jgi:hypothetical protein